jgi:class 3 adenylate cyclase/tetratricopeptide (TPR) repeat protein
VIGQRAATEGERKFVTVMFVDIQGSVAATSKVDSEEWHGIMDRFFSVAGEAIHRFDGTINQYTGDGVMALFGAPRSLEDHAQCACDAALRIQNGMSEFAEAVEQEFGVKIGARIGLHSGDVVVAAIGVELRRDYTAQGLIVGIAARMEAMAGKGEIFVTDETASLAGSRFHFESQGQHEVKGFEEPIHVHALRGTAVGGRRPEAPASPFVGREHEIGLLVRELDRVREGVGRVIGLVGEAGHGKSRVVQEFIDTSRREGFTCYSASASGQRGAPAFEVITALSRELFGIAPDEEQGRLREIVLSRLEGLGPEFSELATLVYDFLGAGDLKDETPRLDPAARRRRLASILHGLLEDVASHAPTLIVIEDAHWLDSSSLEVLPILVDHAAAQRLLFVFTARPGFSAPWMGSSNYQQIPLDPLQHDDCDDMIRNIVGSDAATQSLQHEICVRAAGNPLFVEHSVLSLVANGVLSGKPGAYHLERDPEELEIPPSVRALLSARVDQLGESAKRVLHVASLLGGEFDRDLLEDVADVADVGTALDELVKLRMIEAKAMLPVERYAFHHPLVRETAEQTQLRDRKRELHGRIAESMIERHGTGPSVHMTGIASHLERGGRMLESAETLMRYAGWVYRLDVSQSLAAFRRAMELADRVADEPGAAALRVKSRVSLAGLGYQSELGPAELSQIKDEVRELAEDIPNAPRMLARVYDYYGQSLLHDGRGAEGAEWLIQAQKISREHGDDEIYFCLASSAAFLWRSIGQSGRARDVAAEALAMPNILPTWGSGHHASRVPITLRHHHACALCELGDVQRGLMEMESALDQSLEAKEGQSRCWQVADRVWLAQNVGGRAGLEEITTEAADWAENFGSDVVRCQMMAAWGVLHRWTGRFHDAIATLEGAIAMSIEVHGNRHQAPQCYSSLAEAYMAIGDTEAAYTALTEADAGCRGGGAPNQNLRVQVAHARVQLADPNGDHAIAGEAISRAESLMEELKLAIWRPSLLELRAAWAEATGEHPTRDQMLEEARSAYHSFGDDLRASAVSANPLPILPPMLN